MLWVNLPDHHLLKARWMGPLGQQRNWERARHRDLQAAERMADAVVDRVEKGRLFGWIWRTDAQSGWQGRAIEKIREASRQQGMDLFECIVDQCCYERGPQPSPTRWKILTNAKQLRYKLGRRGCSGHKEHGEWTVKPPAMPVRMIEDIVAAIVWDIRAHRGSLKVEVEMYLDAGPGAIKDYGNGAIKNYGNGAIKDFGSSAIKDYGNGAIKDFGNSAIKDFGNSAIKDYGNSAIKEDGNEILALQRSSLPLERPTGRKLEEIKSQMMRMHRASAAGHSSFESLAKLLQKRGAAQWAVDLARAARELRCVDCDESRRITPAPPASTEEPPMLWEYLGMDVFEYEFEKEGSRMKAKFLIMQDRASRFCMVNHLRSYTWLPRIGSLLSVTSEPQWSQVGCR